MLPISATDAWRAAHPGGRIGLLELSGIDNRQPSVELEARKREAVARLRQRYRGFTRQDFLALPAMAVYARYYARFDKTYHVQLQLESLVLKGRDLPSVSPLVDAYFLAEVETLVLTAGHDADRLAPPVCIDASVAGDRMTLLAGVEKPIRPGDMVLRDAGGVSCAVLYGQDNRSPINPETAHAIFVAYAPAGIAVDLVEAQLEAIEDNLRLFAPQAVVERHAVLAADGGQA